MIITHFDVFTMFNPKMQIVNDFYVTEPFNGTKTVAISSYPKITLSEATEMI